MESEKFSYDWTVKNLTSAVEYAKAKKDVPMAEMEYILVDFTKVFKELSFVLGIAFSDVSSKVEIIRTNRKEHPNIRGFFEFIEMEMAAKIHVLNGNNNSKHNAPEKYKNYNSTARNLLRMMWFLTFLRQLFRDALSGEYTKLSAALTHSYEVAFS